MEKNKQQKSISKEIAFFKDRLFIRQGQSRERCMYGDILYIEASRSYCFIFLKGGSKILAMHPLVKLERELPCHLFMRVHRQYLLNPEHVDAFIGNAVRVGKTLLPVSKRYRKELFGLFHFLEDTPCIVDEGENEA